MSFAVVLIIEKLIKIIASPGIASKLLLRVATPNNYNYGTTIAKSIGLHYRVGRDGGFATIKNGGIDNI